MTAAGAHPDHDLVLVVDFGAQYAQLIARRVREARVYSEIVPHTMPVAEILARNPKAIVLSGGPSSVYEAGAPAIENGLFTAGTPVFGMCYGFQLMAQGLGGEVAHTGVREYGRTPVTVGEPGTLLADVPVNHSVWMSHGDSVSQAPDGFTVLASTAGTPVAARADWPEASGPRKCCTPNTVSRCSSTSSTTSPAAGRPGRCSTSSRSRWPRSASRSATAARSARCPAAWTRRWPPRSCSGRSATG